MGGERKGGSQLPPSFSLTQSSCSAMNQQAAWTRTWPPVLLTFFLVLQAKEGLLSAPYTSLLLRYLPHLTASCFLLRVELPTLVLLVDPPRTSLHLRASPARKTSTLLTILLAFLLWSLGVRLKTAPEFLFSVMLLLRANSERM